jgi:hypothetical protein
MRHTTAPQENFGTGLSHAPCQGDLLTCVQHHLFPWNAQTKVIGRLLRVVFRTSLRRRLALRAEAR